MPKKGHSDNTNHLTLIIVDINNPTPSTTATTVNTTEPSTVAPTPTEPPVPCPMEKMNTKGQKVIKKYKKVKKWEDCAQKCQENDKCKAWTYRPKMKKQKQALLCTIMSKYKSFSKDKFTVSGTSDCPSKAHEGSATLNTDELGRYLIILAFSLSSL